MDRADTNSVTSPSTSFSRVAAGRGRRRWAGLVFGLGWLAAAVGAAEIRVVGTDLLGLEFSKALYAFAGRESLGLALAFDGSRPGLERLGSGRAEVALLVLPDAEAATLDKFVSHVVAYHRVVVLAPASCAVERVSLDQLARVFGAGNRGASVRWSELGATGEFGASAILPLVPDGGAGLTLDYVRHRVLDGRAGAGERYAGGAALASHFTATSRALALAADELPESAGAKTLAVAGGEGRAAVLPTAENLHSGRYPLRLPVRLVYPREHAAALRPLLRFLLGDEAAPLFVRAGVVPLPAAARAQQVMALEKN